MCLHLIRKETDYFCLLGHTISNQKSFVIPYRKVIFRLYYKGAGSRSNGLLTKSFNHFYHIKDGKIMSFLKKYECLIKIFKTPCFYFSLYQNVSCSIVIFYLIIYKLIFFIFGYVIIIIIIAPKY